MSDFMLPLISIIIPTRNEEKYIGKLLDSLVEQTYPIDKFEVFIIDGMSEDNTLQIVQTYHSRLNLNIFRNERIKSTYAFNMGIDKAKGDFFMIVNAHSILTKTFIEEDVNTFFQIRKMEPKLAGVGGLYINKSDKKFGELVGLIYDSFFSGASTGRYKKTPHFSHSVTFGIYDKKIVIKNGKFDEDFISAGNDNELPIRLRRKGYKFFTNPKLIAYYHTRTSFKKFLKQTYNCGVAKGLIVRKGNYTIEWSTPSSYWFIPATFFIYEIFILFNKIYHNSQSSFTLIPFILYWIINIIVSLNLLVKTKNILCIILPVMYFLFHNILGLSSLLGILFGKKVYI